MIRFKTSFQLERRRKRLLNQFFQPCPTALVMLRDIKMRKEVAETKI